MANGSKVDEALRKHYERNRIFEFPFFCIGRQGGRTAVEILARALIMEGKHVYLGQNLGRRSIGTNTMVIRFSEAPRIPSGVSVLRPNGMMFMHEALMWPDYGSMDFTQVRRGEFVKQFQQGILMVCTAKAPEEVQYPIDFEGTVATVDAEAIFSERIGIQPAPFGITALGLFVAATGNLVGLETVKQATREHDRLGKKVRELNVECIQKAFESSRIAPRLQIKGKVSWEEYEQMASLKPAGDEVTRERKSAGTEWRELLPVCDVRKCVCIECLSAYFCPEGVIEWKDESYNVDYSFCKGCGTCALECPEKAIAMEDADRVLEKAAAQAKSKRREGRR